MRTCRRGESGASECRLVRQRAADTEQVPAAPDKVGGVEDGLILVHDEGDRLAVLGEAGSRGCRAHRPAPGAARWSTVAPLAVYSLSSGR